MMSVPHAKYRDFGRGEERGTFEMIDSSAFVAPDPEEMVVLVHKENPNNWSMAHWKAFAPSADSNSSDRITYNPEQHLIYRKVQEEIPQ